MGVPLEDLLQECLHLAVPYNESDESVYDCTPKSESGLHEPTYYSRNKEKKKPAATGPTLVLSLLRPHKILSVSSDLCALFGFTVEELTGRTIKTIQGPTTDSGAITAAIKNTGVLTSSTLTTDLYTRDGSPLEIIIAASPLLADDGSLAGCTLQLRIPGTAVRAPSAAGPARAEREQYRALHNFRTGLMLRQTATHAAAGAGPVQLPPWL